MGPHVSVQDWVNEETPLGPNKSDDLSPEVFELLHEDLNQLRLEARQHRSSLVIGRKGSGKTSFLLLTRLDGDALPVRLQAHEMYSHVNLAVLGLDRRFDQLLTDHIAEVWRAALQAVTVVKLAAEWYETDFMANADDLDRIWDFATSMCTGTGTGTGTGHQDGPTWPPPEHVIAELCSQVVTLADEDARVTPTVSHLVDSVGPPACPLRVAWEAAGRILRAQQRTAVVLVDSLEDMQHEVDRLARTLRGLLQFVDVAARRDEPLNVRVCFPSELVNHLDLISANPAKNLEDSVHITWDARELIRMAGHRLSVFLRLYHRDRYDALRLPREVNDYAGARRVLNAVLPERITNQRGVDENTYAYILRHTQLLPRHLVTILNEVCKDDRRDNPDHPWVIRPAAVRTGVERAEAKIIHDIVTSFRGVFPEARKLCEAAIPNLPFSFDEGTFHEQYQRAGIPKRFELEYFEYARILFDLGALGVVTGDTDLYVRGDFNYTQSAPLQVNPDARLCLHPLFARQFRSPDIVDRGNDAKVVYPAGVEPDRSDEEVRRRGRARS